MLLLILSSCHFGRGATDELDLIVFHEPLLCRPTDGRSTLVDVLGLVGCLGLPKQLAGLLHQLSEPSIDNHPPFGDLGLLKRAAAILQLHCHIPASAASERLKLLLALRCPARNEALKRALEDLRAIGVE